ncbi:hypothetical protein [uncultured Flavobacterium sp.]|uniref:hypothetical protein n=1 Tax=uncultured Flavobacterium sp. TaxID=165435 RepID=UPI0030ED8EF4|tara:strand:- start:107243 stop:107854 length:612 start_codon:yes stop_codon:yes gene_type:complete
MKKIFLFILLIGYFGFSQNDSIDINEYERVYIEVGFVKPLGKMANKFETSPSVGFWFRNRIVNDDYIDFGFNFFIPKKARDVDFRYRDSIVKYKSEHFGISIGTRFAKIISMSNQTRSFNLEWNTGIGLGLNFYEAPNELAFEEKEFTSEVLTTFYISQGIKLNYKNIGFQCHYNFSPYDLFNKKINEKYGSQYLMFGLVYRQ